MEEYVSSDMMLLMQMAVLNRRNDKPLETGICTGIQLPAHTVLITTTGFKTSYIIIP